MKNFKKSEHIDIRFSINFENSLILFLIVITLAIGYIKKTIIEDNKKKISNIYQIFLIF